MSLAYSTAHAHVTTTRGPARDHACTCGRTAAHWAYRHDDPAERYSPEGWAYSTDPTRYDAKCVPCHKRADLARLAQLRDTRGAA